VWRESLLRVIARCIDINKYWSLCSFPCLSPLCFKLFAYLTCLRSCVYARSRRAPWNFCFAALSDFILWIMEIEAWEGFRVSCRFNVIIDEHFMHEITRNRTSIRLFLCKISQYSHPQNFRVKCCFLSKIPPSIFEYLLSQFLITIVALCHAHYSMRIHEDPERTGFKKRRAKRE